MDTKLIFQIFQLVLILIILIFLIRYFWSTYFDTDYYPAEWKGRIKAGLISSDLQKLERKYPDKVRFFNFWFQVERLKKDEVMGDFAELGVYKGKTAQILHSMDPGRTLHLFDTFEGFNENDLTREEGEAATYTTENFSDTNMSRVRLLLGENADIKFYPGYFPNSAKGTEDKHYALVNMDVDLYNPTFEGLKYFYPKLSPGGVIIIHDYTSKWEGLVKAVDEFAKSIPESVIPIPDMESSVMIVRNSG